MESNLFEHDRFNLAFVEKSVTVHIVQLKEGFRIELIRFEMIDVFPHFFHLIHTTGMIDLRVMFLLLQGFLMRRFPVLSFVLVQMLNEERERERK